MIPANLPRNEWLPTHEQPGAKTPCLPGRLELYGCGLQPGGRTNPPTRAR